MTQRPAQQLGHRPGHFHTRGPAADDDAGHQLLPALGIGLDLGALEGAEQFGADGPRVGEALQARRNGGPVVVAEPAVGAACGQHQPVPRQGRLAFDQKFPAGQVNPRRLAQPHLDIGIARQHMSQRRRDVARRQGRGRHLIEQGLEQVVVAPVHQHHPPGRACQRLGAGESREPAAKDNHRRLCHGLSFAVTAQA